MKRTTIQSIFILASFAMLSSCSGGAQPFNMADQFDAEKYDNRLNAFVVADGGRNGFYEQKSVAKQMGDITSSIEPEFIISAGDTHHFDGVESVGDPLWISNFEEIYAHPEFMVSWYPVLGNHEYRGNTQAVIDYSKISRRWNMPSRYYTNVIDEEGTTMRLVMLDTAPLIDKYRDAPEEYPDAVGQSMDAQLQWADSVLRVAAEDWIIVVGHHPIYAYTTKSEQERLDMQQRVDTLLRKHNVDMYICGHIHSYQHLRAEGSDIDYIVNSSASLSRDVEAIDKTQFCSNREGFMVLSADSDDLEAMFVDYEGRLVHTVNRIK